MGSDRSLSARIAEKPALRYLCAVLSLLLASVISSALVPSAGDRVAFGLLLAAVAFCAWYCGPGPSIVAVVLGVVQTFFGFVPRFHPFIHPTFGDWVSIGVFVLSSILVILLGEQRRYENATLIRVQGELEQRVQERTSDLDLVNGNLRELSARLMQLQDDERRRIARELHDSVGQLLAALAMNLSAVRNDVERLTETLLGAQIPCGLIRDGPQFVPRGGKLRRNLDRVLQALHGGIDIAPPERLLRILVVADGAVGHGELARGDRVPVWKNSTPIDT